MHKNKQAVAVHFDKIPKHRQLICQVTDLDGFCNSSFKSKEADCDDIAYLVEVQNETQVLNCIQFQKDSAQNSNKKNKNLKQEPVDPSLGGKYSLWELGRYAKIDWS